jgi:hypothetical protein
MLQPVPPDPDPIKPTDCIKPAPEWPVIQARYVVGGERASDIAKDYAVTAAEIGKRAKRDHWQAAREAYQNSTGQGLRDSLLPQWEQMITHSLSSVVHAVNVIHQHMTQTDSPYRITGKSLAEKEVFAPDPYYLEAYRLAKDVLKAVFNQAEEKKDGETSAGRPVYQCIYTTSEPDAIAIGDSEGEGAV